MFRDWNAVSVGYAQYYSIVMRTITFHTIHVHVGALENYTKSNNNYNKDVTRNSNGQYWGHRKSKCNVSIIFISNVSIILILEHQSQHTTCFMINLTLKHNTTIIPFSIF